MLDAMSRRELSVLLGTAAVGVADALTSGCSPSGDGDKSASASGGNHESGRASGMGDERIHHSTVPVNGAKLHVARLGSGPPLLLLHGWPEFWLTWEPVMLRLADRFELIVPDLRGFGDSDKPSGPFGGKEQGADMIALLEALRLDRVGVVAHDVGGAVAQAMAQAAPDRLAGLLFFSFIHPGVGERFFSPDRLRNIWYMFFQENDFAPALVGATPDTVARYFSFFLKDWPYRKDAFDDVLPAFVENFRKPGNIEGGFNYYRAAIPPRTNPPGGKAAPPAPAIDIPTAVRWPEHDKLFDPAWTDTLPKFFNHLDLKIFPGVGHFPHREDPDAAAEEIAAFFTRDDVAGRLRRVQANG